MWLFDIYRGPGVPEDKRKSIAFSLELRADDVLSPDTDSSRRDQGSGPALKEKLDAALR